eukprot:8549941-Alexandrium_andersonii.AAC.1
MCIRDRATAPRVAPTAPAVRLLDVGPRASEKSDVGLGVGRPVLDALDLGLALLQVPVQHLALRIPGVRVLLGLVFLLAHVL